MLSDSEVVLDSAGVKRATLVEKSPIRIVITDAPSNLNMEPHLRELLALNVKHVARACEPTYETAALETAGIKVHDLQFRDGAPPSDDVRNQWLDLVERCFLQNGIEDNERISVHCVAGLGRAPVLVAIALIEFCGMEPVDAVQYIRERRRGAINLKQFQYLEAYQPTRKSPAGCGACAIM
mmetsp:Transcript_19/g.56  ORF Transcript_19/g.56 Transcript_19/m.56 type:complete len:181 (+) Transcript_19:795-1337(+)|eukprot:CAMPEP_0202039600 /NCGR_PEP_ID=MMETSP0962-20130828/17073_1 /ASSEMBLY_ACC=CAM_ASM_000488 /TAXON_ID=4773 /ORGANISM="Schizochytrium aggregatum, Strain ATCC28209" /LENGTH=180 /DNA_ID=CAMNT_0048603831 /DNA_START=780 /DNA_END=1322 /DNA_ORIENTATION=+